MRLFIKFCSVLLSLFLVACVTTEAARPGSGIKLEKSGTTFDQVWDAAIRSIARTYPIASTNKSEGRIVAERVTELSQWRELVTVFITPVEGKPNTFSVEVIGHKKMKSNLTPNNFDQVVFESIKAELDLIDNKEALKRKLGLTD